MAFIEAIARAAGWKDGAYTSPHLLAYNERVRIDGVDADDADLVAAFEAIEAARGETLLTYFEYGTLAALWLFERSGLDLAILEVGLGGRLDAANLVDADVAVITTVDLDHQDWLGKDREAIGFEKAGIARAWKPLVLGDDDPPASVLRPRLRDRCLGDPRRLRFLLRALSGRARTGAGAKSDYALELPRPRAGGAGAAAQCRHGDRGVARAGQAIARRCDRARAWRRRMSPAGCSASSATAWRWWSTSATTRRRRASWPAWLAAAPASGRTRAVFAALGDKDVRRRGGCAGRRIDAWHLAGLVDSGPRGLDVEAFAQRLVGTRGGRRPRMRTSPKHWLRPSPQAKPGDRILVFGSFHTVAGVLRGCGCGLGRSTRIRRRPDAGMRNISLAAARSSVRGWRSTGRV